MTPGFDSIVGFTRKMEAAAIAVGDLPRRSTGDAALAFKKAQLVSLAAAGAPSQRLRGVGKRGAKLGVTYNVVTGDRTASAVVRATGPWPLIESDTPPHQIPKVRGSRAKRRYVVIAGHPYSRANHPGTKGKHPWAKGVEAAKPLVAAVFATSLHSELTRIF